MATIEIHDGQGGVRRMTVGRDQTLWMGTNPNCEIVAFGPGVAPYHARIRWQGDRYRVEAGPDAADGLEVNGHRVPKAKLRQGDEVRVGSCRVFLIALDDADARSAPAKAAAAVAAVSSHNQADFLLDDEPPRPASPPARSQAPAASSAPSKSPFKHVEKDKSKGSANPEWLQELAEWAETNDPEDRPQSAKSKSRGNEKLAPSQPQSPSKPNPKSKSKSSKADVESSGSWLSWLAKESKASEKSEKARSATASAPTAQPSAQAGSQTGEGAAGKAWGRVKNVLRLPSSATPQPGAEKVRATPMVIGLVVAIVALALMGLGLWNLIRVNHANALYAVAEDSYKNREYRNSVGQFQQFLENSPSDKRAGKAKGMQGLARVRQLTGTWPLMIKEIESVADELANLKEYEDFQMELGEEAAAAAAGLADEATRSGKPEDLALSERAAALHSRIADQTAGSQAKRKNLPEKLAQAREAVLKAVTRIEAFRAMDEALSRTQPLTVYDLRDRLVERYSDQARDKAVTDRLAKANDQLRKAAKDDPSRRPAQTESLNDPLGPPFSLAIRDRVRPRSSNRGDVVFALTQGCIYGIDGATGTPLWHRPVGLSSPFLPRLLNRGDGAALAFDARTDELIKFDAWTGDLIWRQGLEGPIDAPPLVLGNQLFQATAAGDVIRLDIQSGEIQGRLKLGRPLTGTPAAEESGQHLYVVAEDSNLFIINRDPAECLEVIYLGHEAGSIAASPAMIGPYLSICENDGAAKSKWRIFRVESDGVKLRPIPPIELDGWLWSQPAWKNSTAWAVTDKGVLTAYGIRPPEDATDQLFNPLGELKFEQPIQGPAYGWAATERELWVSSGASGQRTVDTERNRLQAGWSLPITGAAAGPVQTAGPLAVFTQRAGDGGALDLIAVDPRTPRGDVRWRTFLGADWLSPPVAEDGRLLTLSPDGRLTAISSEQVRQGGFLEFAYLTPPPGSSNPVIPRATILKSPVQALQRGPGGWLALVEPLGRSLWTVREGAAPIQAVLPITMDAPPAPWDGALLTAALDGRIDLIDPQDGSPRSLPLILPLSKAQASHWMKPAMLEDGTVMLADRAGNLRRLAKDASGKLRETAQVALGASVAADPAVTRDAVIIVGTDEKIYSRAARDLGAQGAFPLGAPLAMAPTAVAGHVLVGDAAGRLIAYAPNGARVWTAKLGAAPAGPPMADGPNVVALTRQGVLTTMSLNDGRILKELALDVEPAGAPLELGDGFAVPAAPGSVRFLKR